MEDTTRSLNRRDEDIRYGVLLQKVDTLTSLMLTMQEENKHLRDKLEGFIVEFSKECDLRHNRLKDDINTKLDKKVNTSAIVTLMVVLGVMIGALELVSHLLKGWTP